MKKAVAVILLAFALTGCGEPKIDGSSEQAFQTSMQKVRDSLAEDKRAAFNDAIQVIAFSQVSMKELMQAGSGDEGGHALIDKKIKGALAGKTGEEVIDYAHKIKQERAANQ